MEDRYLFKAKRLDTHDWILGFLSMHKTGKYFIRPIGGSASSSEEVEKNTICQCTGLKDRNGKLIWENDVLRVFWQDNEAQCEEIAQVTWDKFGYYPWLDEYYCDGCDLFNEVRDIEVIGNIFDNKELLESEG